MQFKDYYQTLNVARDATHDDIRRAYRRLARKYHPDVSKEADAEERFKEVKEAYEVLKDPEKRAAYDRFGQNWRAGEEFRPPPDWEPNFAFGGGGFTGAGDFSEFFEALFGRAGRTGQGRGYGPFRARGDDAQTRLRITLEDAYHGATRNVRLNVGELDEHGNLVQRTRSLDVRIPPGVTAGQRIRLAGQGGPGAGGGPSGDLYLQIELAPHPLFRAHGRDLELEYPVAPWEAALGATVTVPTLGGKVDLKIPAGSQSGRKLRLKGRGLPGKPPGDQYVVLKMVTPSADTAQARDFYQRMEQEFHFDPRSGLGA